METKKTWLSYPLWLLYAVLAGVSIITNLWWFGMHIWEIGRYPTLAVMAAAFCLAAGVWFAGHRLACRMEGKPSVRRIGMGKTAEYVLTAVLCLAAAACRLYLLAFSAAGNIEGGFFYDMASVKAEGGVPWMAHGASHVYTKVLSFVLAFTGNKEIAGAALQLILQVIAILIFYAAVRLLTGRTEALCVLAVLAFARNVCGGILYLTPETLYFLFYAAGLLLCGLYGKRTADADRAERRTGLFRQSVFPAVCGLYIGYMGFLDAAGWTLLLPAAGICVRNLWNRREKKELVPFAVCVMAAAAAALLALGTDAWSAGYSYGERLAVWLDYPVQAAALKDVSFYLGSGRFCSGMLLLTSLLGALAVIGFWFSKTQKQDVWVALLLFFTVCRVSGFGGMDYGFFYTAVWGVLAGIGIRSMGKAQETAYAGDAVQAGDTVQEAVQTRNAVQEAVQTRDTVQEAVQTGDAMQEGDTVQAGDTVQKGDTVQAEDTAQAEPKVKFIENPLPLPKKHVKREMTYAKEIADSEMDFDISVKEDDDFDI